VYVVRVYYAEITAKEGIRKKKKKLQKKVLLINLPLFSFH
jgi:hypothetical protein